LTVDYFLSFCNYFRKEHRFGMSKENLTILLNELYKEETSERIKMTKYLQTTCIHVNYIG
jgi:hypothetical protein